MKAVIVLPTYNERENIEILIPKLQEVFKKIKRHDMHILVVDDNSPDKTADVVSNGVVGQICGLKIIVSNQVDADEACVIVGQEAVTWKSASALQTVTLYEQGIRYLIRAWEVGCAMVTNPEAIHIITNTQA